MLLNPARHGNRVADSTRTDALEETLMNPYLVESDWLASHLSDPDLRIVDIRGLIWPPDAPTNPVATGD